MKNEVNRRRDKLNEIRVTSLCIMLYEREKIKEVVFVCCIYHVSVECPHDGQDVSLHFL